MEYVWLTTNINFTLHYCFWYPINMQAGCRPGVAVLGDTQFSAMQTCCLSQAPAHTGNII